MRDDFYIYSVFTNGDLFLYCPEEKELIFWETASQKISYFSLTSISDIFLFYYYQNHTLFLISDKNNCYQLRNDKIIRIQLKEIMLKIPHLSQFFSDLKTTNNVLSADLNTQSIIYQELNNVTYLNSTTNIKISVKAPTINYHQVLYYNQIFIFLSEAVLIITYGTKKISIDSEADYIFLKACFINEDRILYLIVLSGNKKNNKNNRLFRYVINYSMRSSKFESLK